MKQWVKDILRVTSMKYDLASGTVLQEIMFHVSLERSLNHIKEQTERPEVLLTLELLRGANKNQLIFQFNHNTNLESSLKTAQGYNKVLRELPIHALLSSNDIPSINAALVKVFEQLRNMKNQDQIYSKARQLQLLEALCRDFTQQVLKVISTRPIMEMDDVDFTREISKNVKQVFDTWAQESKKLNPVQGAAKGQ